jgi:glycosyltransferase involved in cell wall biosynthesis
MRIGIFRQYAPNIGGGFQYEIVALDALSEVAKGSTEDFVCLSYPQDALESLATTGGLAYRGLPIHSLRGLSIAPPPPPEAYSAKAPEAHEDYVPGSFYYDPTSARSLRAAGIDLVFQLAPHYIGFSTLLPFVMPIYDLNHRLQPEFPEVSAFGENNIREYVNQNACKFATFILVDSEVGKSDVLRFYGDVIDADRIRVLPYYPRFDQESMPGAADLARVAEKYRLPDRYFFYPAQFWHHKNHELIVRALHAIAQESTARIPVVLCGSYAGYIPSLNFKRIMALAGELGVGDRIHYLGRVPDEDMPTLYRLSAGLVMPTFFGPTNIPPLESWHFGRPVITSDIPGVREQIGDAGLLIDPRSPADLAHAMRRLWSDEAFGAELAERGRRRLAAHSWERFTRAVEGIVTEACQRVREGRTPRYPDMAL